MISSTYVNRTVYECILEKSGAHVWRIIEPARIALDLYDCASLCVTDSSGEYRLLQAADSLPGTKLECVYTVLLHDMNSPTSQFGDNT